MRRARDFALGVFVLALVCPSSARASTISFPTLTDPGAIVASGTFVQDNDLAVFTFVLTGDSTFFASTTDGPGGLDPLLTLLSVAADGSTNLITENDDTEPGNPDATLFDPLSGSPGVFLTAGTYELILTQTYNYFNPQTGGFSFDDTPFYTCDPSVTGIDDPSCTGFQPLGVKTGQTFDIAFGTTPPGTPVPEPGTLALLGTGLAGTISRARRQKY